ncbi:MAG: hypothetical protein GTO29_15175 [Candidatus Latescibacteria bacterium]|nr:hypothetical protein [Candidatus Latescibacterota bacterium]NIO57496.1 hypothetical protein [Candidatus Latescibacterota bacterium]
MGVYKRGKYWWINYSFAGQCFRESTHTTSKKRAIQLLAKRQAAIFEERFGIRQIQPSPFFAEYADLYLKTYSKSNKKPSSHRRDLLSISHLKAYFDRMRKRGKHYNVALCATAARLLERVYNILSQGEINEEESQDQMTCSG